MINLPQICYISFVRLASLGTTIFMTPGSIFVDSVCLSDLILTASNLNYDLQRLLIIGLKVSNVAIIFET